MKVPNLGRAHWGEGALQSQQWRLGGRDWRCVSWVWGGGRVSFGVVEGVNVMGGCGREGEREDWVG